MGGRSWIEGAVPAERFGGQGAPPKSISVEQAFADGKPEQSAEDFRDGLAEQSTAVGYEHQVKVGQLRGFILGLSKADKYRVLGLPEVHAVRPPAKIPANRSAVGLSRGNPGSGALSKGIFRSAGDESSFNVASRAFSNLGPVEFHAPNVMTREEQVAREMQEQEISAAAAQDKTEVASSRFAPAISHADVTDFAQLSSDAQPRPTSKTLVTRSSQPVPNAIYYAPFPENDDPDTYPNLCITAPRRPNLHYVFTSGDLSVESTRLQDEVALCRQRIASYPNEIQGMRAAMGRHRRFRSEPSAGFEAEKNKTYLDWRRALEFLDQRRDVSLAEHDHRRGEPQRASKELEESVLSCRPREAAAKARVSLLRELASEGNPASLEGEPSMSWGWDETSRTEPDAPLDFACRVSKETKRFEPTFVFRGGMDEFRRLKAMYRNASSRELAAFQAFAKVVAEHREDGRDSEGRSGDNREDCGDDQCRGRHRSRKDSRDSRERRPGDRPSAGPRWDEKSDSSCSGSDFFRRGNRRRNHRRRKEKNHYSSAEHGSPSRSTAPVQFSAPSLPRPQLLALPTVHHPAPSEPASKTSSTRLSEVSSCPSHEEDVNRKCYASLDTKGLMTLPAIPFDIADGNSHMNLVNFTASLKEAVA